MAAWWDFGVRGRDDEYLVKSGAITQPVTGYYNISGFIQVGSVSYNPSPEENTRYSVLLLTTGGGTQVYIDYYAVKSTNIHVYAPEENVNVWVYQHRIRVKKGTSEWFVNESNGGFFSSVIAGEGSIYQRNYRILGSSDVFNSPSNCYPRGKQGGGATNQIAMISDSNGLYFYAIGFPCPGYSDNSYNNPASYVGRIPASILNNGFWFDPESDALSESDYKQIKGGAEIPDREIDYDYDGDDIDFPSLPTGASVCGIGKMNIFHPTAAQLATILDVIWTDPTPDPGWDVLDALVENFTKWLYKPEKYLVSLMLMPVNVAGTNTKVYLGKYDTGALSPAISSQWTMLDCGSLEIPLKSGSAFDYAPHVKAMIFLPYIGFRPINVNEIMGGTISIKYYVDMFTGTSVCFIKVANALSNTSVLYSYECNIASQIPITSDNYNNVINSLISASLSLAGGNGGAAAGYGAAAVSGLFSPDVQTSGKLNPNSGALGHPNPYVILHFPVQSVPTGFVNQNGYPSSVNTMLGNLSGYTEVEKIHLNISGAYEEDLAEIQSLLYEGVIL